MNVLVTGGAGYLGGAVVDALLVEGHNVRVYDLLLHSHEYRKPVEFVRGDIRDSVLLARSLAWADAVVWLAALPSDGTCDIDPQATQEINTSAVAWLAGNFDGRIVFASTCSVYGAGEMIYDETCPIRPLSAYARTKAEAEEHLQGRALMLRMGTLYGLGDSYARQRLDLVINAMTSSAIRTGGIRVVGGQQWRALLHVQEAARMFAKQVVGSRTGAYNLCSSNRRIAEVGEAVRDYFAKKGVVLKVEEAEIPPADLRSYRITAVRAESELGFRPHKSVQAGIREMDELLGSGRLVDPTHPRNFVQKTLEGCRERLVWPPAE